MLKQKKSAWLSVGLASLAAMYPALLSCGDRPAGEASMTIAEYASKHAISLVERFTIPDECISGKTLFMCGEAHAIAANEIIKLDTVRFLMAKAGLKHLVLERNPVFAAALDYYINTGDEAMLERLATPLDSMLASREEAEFFRGLRRLNEKLPEERRLRIHGFESRAASYHYGMLARMLPDTEPPKYIKPYIDDIKAAGAGRYNRFDSFKAFLMLRYGLVSDAEVFREYLGSRYPIFEKSVLLLYDLDVQSLAIVDDAANASVLEAVRYQRARDAVLFDRVKKLEAIGDGTVLVWYGAAHVSMLFGRTLDGYGTPPQCSMKWFGELVKGDEALSKRSLSLTLLYDDCFSYYGPLMDGDSEPVPFFTPGVYPERLAEAMPGVDLSLLDLRLPRSPFLSAKHGAKGPSWYTDCVLMVRNSGAMDIFK